jgi:hypothetical protein
VAVTAVSAGLTTRRIIEPQEMTMRKFLRLLSAGPFFFVSAWLLMLFAGIVSRSVGIRPFGYLTAMVVTIGLWLVLTPAINAVSPRKAKE